MKDADGMVARAVRIETGAKIDPLRPPAPPPTAPRREGPRPPRDSEEAVADAIRADNKETERARAILTDTLERYRHLDEMAWVSVDEDPRWQARREYEAFVNQRDEREAETRAKLRELWARRSLFLFFQDPSPAEFERFMKEEIIPTYNELVSHLRLCPECCRQFAVQDPRTLFCSNGCSARARNRGRDKANGGRSAPEARATRFSNRLQRHWQSGTCPVKTGNSSFCEVCERLMTADEVTTRSVSVPDVEQPKNHASGGLPADEDPGDEHEEKF
jgi:hypothetical protein